MQNQQKTNEKAKKVIDFAKELQMEIKAVLTNNQDGNGFRPVLSFIDHEKYEENKTTSSSKQGKNQEI